MVDYNRDFASLRRLVRLKLEAFDWITKSKWRDAIILFTIQRQSESIILALNARKGLVQIAL